MKLLTKENLKALPPLYTQDGKGKETIAYVKFFTPDANATWYMTEYDPETKEFFGWTDLGIGQGMAEFGYTTLAQLESYRGPMGLKIERDMYFEPTKLDNLVKEWV